MVNYKGKYSLIGLVTTLGASLCCLIPLLIMVLGGLSTALGLMSLTMPLRPILFPLGVVGLAFSWTLYVREKKMHRRQPCQIGQVCKIDHAKFNLTILVIATLIMAGVIYADYLAVL